MLKGETLDRQRRGKARSSKARRAHQSERFETLLDEMSGAMSRVPGHEIDGAIERWLREIVLALEIDRSTVWEKASAELGFAATHWWARPGIPKLPRKMVSMRISPWLTAEALAGRPVMYSSPADLPTQERSLKRFLAAHGPEAQLMLPLEIGGAVVGGLTFGKFRGRWNWPPALVRRLRVVAQIIAGALDRKRTFIQGRKLREEVTVAARRAMMGQLAASIAHELNQPLSAVLSNVNAVRRMISGASFDRKEAVAALSDVAEDTKRAADIIRRVRALFQDNLSPNGNLEIGALLSELEGLLRSEAMLRRVSLRIEAAPCLPSVTGDRVQLQQCVLNLVLNAFDSIPPDSTRREVLIRAVQEESEWVTVAVRDTGRGIDDSVAGRLFEPFVTTKANGMGMGLLVTRCILERHGGRVCGNSNADLGATFKFTLPAIAKP